MHDLIRSRCRASLVNASGDLLQENQLEAVEPLGPRNLLLIEIYKAPRSLLLEYNI